LPTPTSSSQVQQLVLVLVVEAKYHLKVDHQKRLMICIRGHRTLQNSHDQAAKPANGSLYLLLTLLPSLKMIPSASGIVMTTRR